jgi:N-acetylglutamate synthase-like GNAT family acetyltransferase
VDCSIHLPRIENAAATLFLLEYLPESLRSSNRSLVQNAQQNNLLWVTVDEYNTPIAFLLADIVDRCLHREAWLAGNIIFSVLLRLCMLIKLVTSEVEILQCLPVLTQLRPQIQPENFLAQIQRQQQQGYQLAILVENEVAIAVAGFSISECLAWGKFMYIYDLVVDEKMRNRGYGDSLLAWSIDFARQQHCQQLHLDSGVQRFDAHRFYLQHRLNITSHHFCFQIERISKDR